MLQLKTETEVKSIIKNVIYVIKNDNINGLTKKSYNFIMLSQGFIAHFNIHGFISFYETADNLKRDILFYQNMNQWNNFRFGEPDYEYMMQRKYIYNAICDGIK
jgi:hypothetical protein